MGEVVFAEFEFQVAPLCDGNCVRNGFGNMTEGFFHFLRCLHIEGFRRKFHPVRIFYRLPRLNAQQGVVRFMVLHVQIVTVVRGHKRDPRVLRKTHQFPIGLFLFRDSVVLEFEIKVLFAEDVLVFQRGLFCVFIPALQEQPWNLSGQARRHADQALAVLPEQFLIDTGFVIKALQISGSYQLHEVFIPLSVAGKKDQMVKAFVVLARIPGLFKARTRRHVHFAADDRFDPRLGCLEIEIEGAEEVAVISDGYGGHFQVNGFFYQGVEGIRAVEQAVFGVEMQVDEIRVMHRSRPKNFRRSGTTDGHG